MNELAKIAYQLAEEIRGGHWNHISDLATRPAQDCQEIIEVLSQRCPGYTQEQYNRAISTGLFVSR